MKKLKQLRQHPATIAQNAIKIPEGQKLLSAFPTSHMHMNQHGNPGMLMVDYFAINILSSVISKGSWPTAEHINKAYSIASKMVEVRREYVDP